MEAPFSKSLFSPALLEAVSRLEEAGYEAYLVGGALRDLLLGKEASDFDVTTSANLGEIRRVFDKEKKICPNGEKHGTITIRLQHENIEISSFRHEESEEATLENDLHHRDLTINSLVYGKEGLIDLVGAKKDLEAKIIRFNEPMDRVVKEDPLRLLRALRFHATLGFEVEEESAKVINRYAPLLKNVSKERVNRELQDILLADDIEDLLLTYKEVFFEIFPILRKMDGYDQNSPWHANDLYTHTVHVVKDTKSSLILRIAALFHDIGKLYTRTEGIKEGKPISHYYGHPAVSARKARDILLGQKLLISHIPEIYFYIFEHDRRVSPNRKSVAKFLYELSKIYGREEIYERAEDFFNLQNADRIDHIGVIPFFPEQCLQIIRTMLDEQVPLRERELAINGKDLERIGFIKEGISKAKTRTLFAVMEGRIPNEKEDLLAYGRALYKSGLR